MTIVMFGGKRGRLASRRTPSQPWSTGVAASSWGVLCTSQNRWHHEVEKLCGYIETTSQDISQEVNGWSQMGHPNGQWPQAYFQSCGKWLKDNKVKVLEWPSQSSDLNLIEHLWAELKKCVWARRPTNLTQLHQLCQEERAKIHPTYCGKLVEGYPKRLTHIKHFKGNATKYCHGWLKD